MDMSGNFTQAVTNALHSGVHGFNSDRDTKCPEVSHSFPTALAGRLL
jgi:hypothetical protein